MANYRRIGALVVFLIALVVYILTLAPTVTLMDSGELILAAHSLGIPHPPGFPAYVLIGHIFSLLPVGSIALRINFMSAFFAALSSAVIFLLVFHPQGDKDGGALRLRLAAFIAALSFAFSRTLWTWAVQAEVYALGIFLILLIIASLLTWRQRWISARGETGAGWLYTAGFIFGLGLANHHITVLLLAPALLYLVVNTGGWRFLTSRRFLFALIFCLLGLGVYLYLPLRSAGGPLLNWGDPSTPGRFLRHVMGKQYQAITSFSSTRLLEQAGEFIVSWAVQFTIAGAVLALLGTGRLWKRDRFLFWFFLLIVLVNIAFVLWRTSLYIINTDIDAWYLPTFAVCAIWMGWGILTLFDWSARRGRGVYRAAVVLLLIFPLAVLAANFHRCDMSGYYLAGDYASNTLKAIEPNGVILTRDWRLSGPLLYLQHVEGLRPDVTVIDCEQVRGSWYARYLRRIAPSMIEAVRDEAGAFQKELSRYEEDPRINLDSLRYRYGVLMNSIIRAALTDGRPVYLTVPMENEVGSEREFQWVPSGLAFRLYPEKGDYPLPTMADFKYRGLNDGTAYLDEEARQMREQYALMLTARGSYLESQGKPGEARSFYRQALELEPGHPLVRRLLEGGEPACELAGKNKQ